jgi:general secretion pathway protein M
MSAVRRWHEAVQRWRERDPRARRVLALAAGAAAVLLAFALLWQPAMREQRRLAARLAALQQDEARLNAMAAEARRLLAAPAVGGAPTGALALADIEALARSIAGEGIAVSAHAGGGARLMSAGTPFAKWWTLVDALHRRHGVVLGRLQLTPRTDAPDQVAFDMVVAR